MAKIKIGRNKIVVRMHLVTTSPNGRVELGKPKILAVLPNTDFAEADVFNKNFWRNWLLTYRNEQGKTFPKSKDGVVIAYRIDSYGLTKDQREKFFSIVGGYAPPLYFNFFPGYDYTKIRFGEQKQAFMTIKDIVAYGRI